LLADWDFARAGRVVAALGDPLERATAAGIVALATERRVDGERSLRAALSEDPGNYEARVALVRAERSRLVAGDRELGALAAPLGDPARAVVEGWAHQAAGDLGAVHALEARLADARPSDAMYADAVRLRAAWRIASADPDAADEALALLD